MWSWSPISGLGCAWGPKPEGRVGTFITILGLQDTRLRAENWAMFLIYHHHFEGRRLSRIRWRRLRAFPHAGAPTPQPFSNPTEIHQNHKKGLSWRQCNLVTSMRSSLTASLQPQNPCPVSKMDIPKTRTPQERPLSQLTLRRAKCC